MGHGIHNSFRSGIECLHLCIKQSYIVALINSPFATAQTRLWIYTIPFKFFFTFNTFNQIISFEFYFHCTFAFFSGEMGFTLQPAHNPCSVNPPASLQVIPHCEHLLGPWQYGQQSMDFIYLFKDCRIEFWLVSSVCPDAYPLLILPWRSLLLLGYIQHKPYRQF